MHRSSGSIGTHCSRLTALLGMVVVSLALSACTPTSKVTAPEVIEIPGETKYLDLPAEMTRRCLISIEKPTTNGGLKRQWDRLQAALVRCDGQIQEILRLQDVSRETIGE